MFSFQLRLRFCLLFLCLPCNRSFFLFYITSSTLSQLLPCTFLRFCCLFVEMILHVEWVTLSFYLNLSFVFCTYVQMCVWNFWYAWQQWYILAKSYTRTPKQPTKPRNEEKKKHQMRNDHSSSGANNLIVEMFVCIRKTKKYHKNTRKYIKKLVPFAECETVSVTICAPNVVWSKIIRSIPYRIALPVSRPDQLPTTTYYSIFSNKFKMRTVMACTQKEFQMLWFIVLSESQEISWDFVPFVSQIFRIK